MVPPHPFRDPVDQSLACIGFGTEGNCNIIHNGGRLKAFDNFVGLTESDIRDMASGFSKNITDQVRINFGMRRVKYTMGNMQLAYDESRCFCTASLTGIADVKEYKSLLVTDLDRSTLKKVEADQANTITKAEDPGKFKDECI